MIRLDSRSLRRRLLVGASLSSLILAGGVAEAQGGRAFGGRGAGPNPAAAATQAAQAEATRASQASSATRRAIASFARAAATRDSMTAAQAAARAAAQAAQSNIPNGLGQGGLQVADGVQLDPSLWVGASGPTQTTGSDGRTVVTVGQNQQKAILTWDSFNVGRETDLVFNQGGHSDWVALNRVTDASADPSKILGKIKADGSVYIINRNGVIFGGASTVNVRNLIAATANISDIQFLERGISAGTRPGQNSWDPLIQVPSFTDAGGEVIVEAGALITTSKPATVVEGGGFVALMGTKVENRGTIITAKGQTVLAAGDNFAIRPGYGSNANTGSTTRGLEFATTRVAGSDSGAVVNSGIIEAAEGDITLIGRNVLQDGVAIATTSVTTRGTIHLLTDLSDSEAKVTLSGDSLTLILPELDSKATATNAQRDALLAESKTGTISDLLNTQGINKLTYMLPDRKDMSRVEIMTGGTVDFEGGSQTIAQGGQIAVVGLKRVTVADGAELNVSGVRGVAMDMASNNLKINLQPFELRDSPLNREGDNLKNNDIWIDIRDLVLLPSGTGGHEGDRYYTPGGLIEVGGHLGNTTHTIGEWVAQGGTINVRSNEIVAGKDAVFDISGGSMDYAAGWIQSTRMLGSDGKLYDLGKAPAGVKLISVGDAYVVKHDRWGEAFQEVYSHPLFNSARSVRWEEAYTVGRDAGVLTLSAPTVLFDGQIVADVIVGDRQTGSRPTTPPIIKDGMLSGAFPNRLDGYSLPQNVTPLAGGFYVGNRIWQQYTPVNSQEVPFSNTVTIGEGGGSTGVQSGVALTPDLTNQVVLSAESLSNAGLGSLRVNGGDIKITGDLSVSAGGDIAMQATNVSVEADITARSGSISLAAVPPCSTGCNTLTDLTVAEGVTLDARGLWVNVKEGGDARDLAHIAGGQVMLESRQGRLDFQAGALIDVSAGGAILEDGKTVGAKGGNVGFAVSSFPRANANEMILDGDIKAYGSGEKGGGTLTISAGGRAITVGDKILNGGDTLEGGEPAPIDLQLLQDVVLKAGDTLPFDYAYTIDFVGPGQPLPGAISGSIDFEMTLTDSWVIPEGWEVYDLDWNIRFGGEELPAGSVIMFGYGPLPEGYVLPAHIWPDGMRIPPLVFSYKKGDTLTADLTLAAGRTIAAGTVMPDAVKVAKPLHLDADLFQTGFSKYDVTAGGDMLVSGAIDVAAPVRRFTDASAGVLSGADPEAAMELWLPEQFREDAAKGQFVQRQGASLSLRAYGWGERNWVSGYGTAVTDPLPVGNFTLSEGASIRVDDGQSVSIVSGDAMRIDGSITARGGKVTLAAGPAENMSRDQPPQYIVYDATRSIWLGEDSVIDVSGRALNAVGADGLRYAHLSKGGDISVGGVLSAFVVVRPGAVLDASGAATEIDYRGSALDGAGKSSLALASDGGSIRFASQYGIYLDGDMRAHAGGAGASGGTLSIALSTPHYAGLGNQNGRQTPDFMRRLRAIELGVTGGSGLAADLQFGECFTACWTPGQTTAEAEAANQGMPDLLGKARIGVDQIEAGGFGSLNLQSSDLVLLDGAVNLNLSRNLTVAASAVALMDPDVDASLNAAYVKFSAAPEAISNTIVRQELGYGAVQRVPLIGEGTLKITGGLIDLGAARFGVSGSIGLSGGRQLEYDYAAPANLDFVSRSDIRMTGGSVYAMGDMSLTAAQVYPMSGVTSALYAGVYTYRMPIGGTTLYNTLLPGSTISFHKLNGVTPAAPLSVYGSLTVGADIINQGGVIRAPLGSIALGVGGNTYVPGIEQTTPTQQGWGSVSITTTEVNLLPGSLTSASAKDLVIPFGGTTDGIRWLLNGVERTGGVNFEGVSVIGSLRADAGSVLDLRGGGTPSGAGFIPGRGGSVDILKTALANVSPAYAGLSDPGNQVYAIVPGYAGSATPTAIDGHAQPGIGQQIVIPEGVKGLPAGVYTLLPAEYALTKGAFRVELGSNMPAGASRITGLADGSTHLGVTTAFANTDVRGALKVEAILTPADVVRTYSQYNETSFGEFLLQRPATALFDNPVALLPQDGKSLLLALVAPKEGSDRPAFSFKGTGLFDAAEGGVGGSLAVTAGSYYEAANYTLEVLADGQAATDGAISVYASDLNAVNARVMTIGGVAYREIDQNGSRIKIVAGGGPYNVGLTPYGFDAIVVREGAVLSGPQVLLIADRNADITVEAGAQINTLGKGKQAFDSTQGYTLQANNVNVLTVSNGLLEFSSTATTGSTGVISVADGASLYSDGTLSFVTQGGVELGENVNYGARYLGFSSAAVNIGDSAALADAAAGGVLPAGIALNQSVLDRLMRGDQSKGAPKLERLILSASQSINFYGSISLDTRDATTGKSNLQLVLNSPALYGRGDANDVAQIITGTLVWNGVLGTTGPSSSQQTAITGLPGAPIANGPGTGLGALNLVADRIVLGYQDDVAITASLPLNRLTLGFGTVNLTAANRVEANHIGELAVYQSQAEYGKPGQGGVLNVTTPLLTGRAGSQMHYKAGDRIVLTSNGGAASDAKPELGAEIKMTAGAITADTTIALPSGRLVMTATEGDIVLGDKAKFDLSGKATDFFDETRYGWGGDVELESAKGDVVMASGATIDLSADYNHAGTLKITAVKGTVTLDGEIDGESRNGDKPNDGSLRNGSIDIRANVISDFAELNERLNDSDVTDSRTFIIKSGDIVIGDEVKARQVTISADGGDLTVVGTIDASGHRPGSIRLSARDDLTLASTAKLDTSADKTVVDSYGQPIEASNRANIELTSAGGTLTLAAGATLDLSSPDGQSRGRVELNAPRIGGDDVAIEAGGALTIRGADSLSVNGFRTYELADGVIDQDLLDDVHVDNTAFIDAAIANQALLARLAGLRAYADAFHLRPGVELVSAPGGSLTVSGDLNLAGYRYASLNADSQLTNVYGSGEAGVLLIRAADDLDIHGSITDGFAEPARTPDDNGWVLYGAAEAGGVGAWQADHQLSAPVRLAAGSSFDRGVTLDFDIQVTNFSVMSNTLVGAGSSLATAVTLPQDWVATSAIRLPDGTTLEKGSILKAGTILPADSRFDAGAMFPMTVTLKAMTWPKGVKLPGKLTLSATAQLQIGDVIPRNTNVVIKGLAGVQTEPVVLDKSYTLIGGASGTVTTIPGGANSTVVLDFDIEVQNLTNIRTGVLIPFGFVTTALTISRGGPWTAPVDIWASEAAFQSGAAPIRRAGDVIPNGQFIPARAYWGAGAIIPTVLGTSRGIAPTIVPAGTPMNIFATDVSLNSNVTVAAGTLIPTGMNLQLLGAGGPHNTRPVQADGTQGRIWAVAPMLAPGSQSWSMRLVAGADIGSADGRTLRAATDLAESGQTGDLTLSDRHYVNPQATTADGFNSNWLNGLKLLQNFSVIRTGVGSLDLLAGGSYTQMSLYGVYTAGTPSAEIGGQTPDGYNVYNQPRGILAGAQGLANPWIGANFDGYADSIRDYQAWYPEHGGDLLLAVQGDLTGFATTRDAAFQRVGSGSVANWLWRQGGYGVTDGVAAQLGQDIPTAWWINFGGYVPNNAVSFNDFVNFNAPMLEGFMGIGTLGGGNLTVRAGGDAGVRENWGMTGSNETSTAYSSSALNFAVASTGRVTSVIRNAGIVTGGALTQTGGGDIDIRLGGTLNPAAGATTDGNGSVTNLRGDVSILAGAVGASLYSPGAEVLDPRRFDPTRTPYRTLQGGLTLVIGDSDARIDTRGDLVLAAVGDPGSVVSSAAGSSLGYVDANGNYVRPAGLLMRTSFSLWHDDTSVSLFSAGGDATPIVRPAQGGGISQNAGVRDGRYWYPPILRVTAAEGNIYWDGGRCDDYSCSSVGIAPLELAPSPLGQVEFLAGTSILAGGYRDADSGGRHFAGQAIAMSGMSSSLDLLPNPFRPVWFPEIARTPTGSPNAPTPFNGNATLYGTLLAFQKDTATGTLLDGPKAPALFYAADGDVSGLTFGFITYEGQSQLYVNSGSMSVRASRDILNLGIGPALGCPPGGPAECRAAAYLFGVANAGGFVVHNDKSDISLISAGRDIIYANMTVAGPGNLVIEAGRNIYQADKGRFTSIGPLFDLSPATRNGGAAISIMTGVANGPNYDAFTDLYLNPANLAETPRPLAEQPGKVAKTYEKELIAWLDDRFGYKAGNADEALAYFKALDPLQRQVFARLVYFDELKAAGREYNDASGLRFGSYLRGRNAIAVLLPEKGANGEAISYEGDLTMFGGSGVRTLFGGNVEMLVAGGQALIGVGGIQPPATAGVLSMGSGDIDIYSLKSVLLGQSRVFTTFGGDLFMWSAEGDINAGRGSKSTAVYQPPRRVYDLYGNVTLSPPTQNTGAGIATLAPIPEIPAGDVDLIAPLGTIDAGEAGIRVSGNVNLAALAVVNAANIQVKGDAVGIPVVAAVNTGALTAASSASSSVIAEATRLAERAKPKTNDIPAIITGRFLGFGE